MDALRHLIKPGFIEIFCGAMKSGKTRELLHRIDQLSYIEDCSYLLVKPKRDTRTEGIFTRSGKEIPCVLVDDPDDILRHVGQAHRVIAIDEAQFFDERILDVVMALARSNRHVLIAGLDLNYRGEPFGPMPLLLCHAHIVHKLQAICEVPGCNNIATVPQRFRNGEPAHYDAPTIVIEGDELYEARCVKHHVVPGKHSRVLPVDDKTLDQF